MPPSGPRSRPSAAQASGRGAPPTANQRNEVFENIFGRPAGGHHLGPNPPPQSHAAPPSSTGTGGYPYSSYNAPSSSSTYLNPAQPSYPPGVLYNAPQPQPPRQHFPQQHTYQPQPTSNDGGIYNRPSYDSNSLNGNGYGNGGRKVSQGYAASAYGVPAGDLPDRRASLAPSTYSTQSSASFYSPNPDSVSPPPPRTNRLPSNPTPAAFPAPRVPSGTGSLRQQQGLTPAQAYQASQSHSNGNGDGNIASPASAVFPHRSTASPIPPVPPIPNPKTDSVTSFASTASSGSRLPTSASTTSFHKPTPTSSHSRSPPPRGLGPTIDENDRSGSSTPDYIGQALGKLAFETSPQKGLLDDFGFSSSAGSHSKQDYFAQPTSQAPPIPPKAEQRQGSFSSTSRASMHQRMASDSSIASSVYTTTGPRTYMAPLSQIEPTSAAQESFSSPTTPTGSESGFAAHAVRRLSGRKSMESTVSLPLPATDSPLPPGAAPSATGFDGRATSFSGSSTTRKDVVKSMRSESIGHGSQRRSNPVGAPPSSFAFPTPLSSQRSLSGTLTRSTSTARAAILQSMPPIYPALLSQVAEAFKKLLTLSELVKDGITYKDAFDGRTAVGIIADIIKTPDRNLALLLGRALDAQKFFHDVTYDHRLRDNPHEVYQFKERLTAAPFMSTPNGGTATAQDSPISEHAGLGRTPSVGSTNNFRGMTRPPIGGQGNSDSGSMNTTTSEGGHISSSNHHSTSTPATSTTTLASPKSHWDGPHTPHAEVKSGEKDEGDTEDDLPVGVFTLLTDCYSPTCSRERLCYSINCPRRLEQMKRLNMKPEPGLSRKLSQESIVDVKETGTLWIHSVSQEILDSVDDTEKKRQEAINEVIYTERDFVRDLEYLKESWVKPLRTSEVIDPKRRDDFVRQVFWNVHDVLSVNIILAEKLTKRQKKEPVVSGIGDLFLERVPLFEPFVVYGSHQLFGKYEFEKEKGSNPLFQKFVDETERKPESRKLELNGYLTKPTTRLGRYPLLLEAVLKYTPDDHPDKKILPEVIKLIRGFLTKVNIESGKSENIFELAQIEQSLVFRPGEHIDLRLRDKSRELVHKGPLKRRGGNREEIADLTGFLFDHAFLLVKPKWVQKSEQYKVYRRPIPLELLVLVTPDDSYNSSKLSASRAANKLMPRQSNTSSNSTSNSKAVLANPPKPESKHGFSLTVIHLGKKGYSMQLWVDTYMSRKKWLESIDKQQATLRERSCVFVSETITEGGPSFTGGGLRKVNCVSPYDMGHRMIYGTDDGVYFSNLRDDKLRDPVKVINLLDVTQVDVIEEFQLLIVLHERCVTTFPLDCLDPNDANAALKRGKRISSHTSFIKSGICLGKTLIAIVKSSTLSSTIKVMEPIDQALRNKKAPGGFMKRLNGRDEALKLFKEFYIPTESSSVHFLKTKLCVGCTKGFEIVDLETLDMQGLLDPSDASLDFVLKRDNVRPIAIYRIEEDFLLCYDEFAFYVNKNGWRSRPKWAIVWEGLPTAFALQYPYVIAFEPTFIEVHHVETGHLVQIIPGSNIQCLFADTPPSRVNAPVPVQPNRQLMYPPGPGGGYGRPPPQAQAGYPQQGYFPPQQQQQGYMQAGRPRPPAGPGPGPYGMPPPPSHAMMVSRFARQQVIFTSDDSHVQFLKFPSPQQSGGGQRGGTGVPPVPGKAHSIRGSH
ncbi:hypothetical protein I302_108036 [Kwoniella bestiolae CBS 10118]|uniref:Rho guanyl-nucleotide exchange factor n=1 Tax=Kwoniella bestiolae CBS 10118 TaxID=1296100 RepID=A0A1B9FWU7_9TREE|nr:rho guanyl-nucleotide exchange factor [Kwoniella bestiolae CBS 10118]OCF23244.1 rho guanyl-nucleotide exchange factor [Kwoniella bestiolae CBS 10118]